MIHSVYRWYDTQAQLQLTSLDGLVILYRQDQLVNRENRPPQELDTSQQQATKMKQLCCFKTGPPWFEFLVTFDFFAWGYRKCTGASCAKSSPGKVRQMCHRSCSLVYGFYTKLYTKPTVSKVQSLSRDWIIGSAEALPILCVRCARCERERERERERDTEREREIQRERERERERDGSDVTLVYVRSAEIGEEVCTFPCQNAETGEEFCTFPCQKFSP